MEIVERENRFGKYYIVKTTLWVKGKPFRVSQKRVDPSKPGYKWDLTRSQMLKILEMTKPSDWEFRYSSYSNGWTTYIVKAGYAISSVKGKRQRYMCMNCGRTFVG